jgi:hypothetical protein
MKTILPNVFKYPQSMGAYNALMENHQYITEKTLTLAIEYCEAWNDNALLRTDIEQAIKAQKA